MDQKLGAFMPFSYLPDPAKITRKVFARPDIRDWEKSQLYPPKGRMYTRGRKATPSRLSPGP